MLALAELGQAVGGMDYSAVAAAVRRVEQNARRDRPLRSALRALKVNCTK